MSITSVMYQNWFISFFDFLYAFKDLLGYFYNSLGEYQLHGPIKKQI